MLQNRISILDSVICIVFAVLVLLYMNPLIAVISIAAMAIPSLLPSLFYQGTWHSTGNGHEINNILQ